jgi:hypothetical protein
VQINVNNIQNEREYVDLFIGEDLLWNISGQTNLYASNNEVKAHSRIRKWPLAVL